MGEGTKKTNENVNNKTTVDSNEFMYVVITINRDCSVQDKQEIAFAKEITSQCPTLRYLFLQKL